MATYKAEFLHRYYEGRLRPRSAYALGLVHRWAPIGGAVPSLANFLTQTPFISSVSKRIAGIAPHRDIPPLCASDLPSAPSFARRKPFEGRTARRTAGQSSLWPDTFNNYFHPETAQSAAEVLTAAGFEVRLPSRRVCCGRPLYDQGMLGLARELLEDVLDVLRDEVRRGLPVVVLEPSCAAVFQDELQNLFPHDPDARRLSSQTFLFAEFLEREMPGWTPGRLSGAARHPGALPPEGAPVDGPRGGGSSWPPRARRPASGHGLLRDGRGVRL